MERGLFARMSAKREYFLSVLHTLCGQGCPRSFTWLFALSPWLTHNLSHAIHHRFFRGKEKWQTYLFVRNQMVRT